MRKHLVHLTTNQRLSAFLQIISLSLSVVFASQAVHANQSSATKVNTNQQYVDVVETTVETETTLGNAASAGVDEKIAGSVLFQAPTDNPHRFFTFTFQNDVFLNRDFGYTNGVGFQFGKGPFLSVEDNVNPVTEWLTRPLYIRKMPNKVHGIANMFFQRLQTPQDITIAEAQPDDLPYVGLLALQTTLYAYDKDESDQFSTFIGIVGPAALGEEAQSGVHALIDSDDPKGWDHQIDNEIIFKAEALRVKKLYRNYYADDRGIDVVGIGQLGLGTLSSEVLVGGAVRWGSNLQFSHATFSLQADRQVNSLTLSPSNNFFVFAGVMAGYVANQININGNTFRDSASLPIRHEYNQATAGIVFKYGKLSYVAQVTTVNSRTTIPNPRGRFGAFSITWNLD